MMMKKKNYVIDSLVVVFFFLLTIIHTYPLVIRLYSSFFGDPRWTFDSRASIYSIWLTKHQWLNKIPFTFNPLLGLPFGVDMANSPSQWGLRIPLLLLSLWRGEIFSFNIFIIASFVLSAVFMYYLVLYITKDRMAGFISGLIYSFSPYHTLKAFSHLGLAAVQWIPLYVLFLLLLESKKSYKYAFFCSISFVIVILSSYYYGYIAIVITIIFMLTKAFYNKNYGLRYYLFFIGATIVLVSVFMSGEIRTAIWHRDIGAAYVKPYYDLFKYSAKISDYFHPSEYHPLFGKLDFWFIKSYNSASRHWAEKTLYIGIMPFILAVYGIISRKTKINQSIKVFLLISACAAFLFSLPPLVKIGKLSFYMPNYFAYKALPMFRCPARFGLIVIFISAIFAGAGALNICNNISSRIKKRLFVICVVFLILFEFAVVPPFRNVDISSIPEVYKWLADIKQEKIIVEYPFAPVLDTMHDDEYLFYQRFHKKRMINGAPGGDLGDAFRVECANIADTKTLRLLTYLGADYAVVHKNKYSANELQIIEMTKGLKLVKDFQEAAVYAINAAPEELPVVLWRNIGAPEKWSDGNYWMWTGNNAIIWMGNGRIQNMEGMTRRAENKKVDIKFRILSFAKDRELEIYVNNVLLRKLNVFSKGAPELAQTVMLKDVLLKPGENIIELCTPQGEERIGNVLDNNDERRVSFAISGVEVKK